MSSKLKKILLVNSFLLLLLALYLGISSFFASEVVEFRKFSLVEDQKRLDNLTFQSLGLPRPEDFSFQNGPVTLKAWYFKNPKPKKCGVLLLHGYGRTRWSVLKYSPLFWKRGCDIFAFDHRRHGESGGAYGTFGFYEKFDLENGIDTFSDISQIPENKIGVLGESYGAATALMTMGLGKKVAFVIADSPYSDMETIVTKKGVDIYGPIVRLFAPMALFIAGKKADFDPEDVSPKKYAASIEVPVLLIHSNTDAYTPFAHSQIIYDEIQNSLKKIFITDWGAEHGKSINKDYAKYEAIVDGFLKEFIPSF